MKVVIVGIGKIGREYLKILKKIKKITKIYLIDIRKDKTKGIENFQKVLIKKIYSLI